MSVLRAERLKEACDRAGLEFAEVVEGAEEGKFQFHDTEKMVAVTHIGVTRRGKTCHVLLLGGELEGLPEIQGDIEDFAQSQGCYRILTYGRPGFMKVWETYGRKQGYFPRAVEFEKLL